MADVNDLARIDFILNEPDEIVRAYKDGKPVFSDKHFDKHGNPVPVIEYIKKIDGHVYVSEAVADVNRRHIRITSVRITKNKLPRPVDAKAPHHTPKNDSVASISQTLDAKAPNYTPKNDPANISNSTLLKGEGKVKGTRIPRACGGDPQSGETS